MSCWQCTSGWVLGTPVPLPLGLRSEFWNQMGVAESPCHFLSPDELLHSLMVQFVHLHKEDSSTYLAVMWWFAEWNPGSKAEGHSEQVLRKWRSLTRFSLGPHGITDHQRNITNYSFIFSKVFLPGTIKIKLLSGNPWLAITKVS